MPAATGYTPLYGCMNDDARLKSLSRTQAAEGQVSAFTVGVRPEELPCGGCKYCLSGDNNWRAFTETADDTVPLVSQGNAVISCWG